MQVLKIHSYAYFGTEQFPVDLPLICSTEFVNAVKDHPTDFERTYSSLGASTPADTINRNFGMNIYSAIKKLTNYIQIDSTDPTPVDMSLISEVFNILDMNMPTYLVTHNYTGGTSEFSKATQIINVNGNEYNLPSPGSNYTCAAGKLITNTSSSTGITTLTRFNTGSFMPYPHIRLTKHTGYNSIVLYFDVVPDDFIINNKANESYRDTTCRINVSAEIQYSTSTLKINGITFTGTNGNVSSLTANGLLNFFGDTELPDYSIVDEDVSNPYGEDGTSTTGGGDGTLGPGGLDDIDPTDVPELPSLSAAATGFITMYNPSSANLSALGTFLWSGMFDLDTYKKLFADPMEGIIGLGIVPVLPNSAGAKNIMFGNVDSGINCSYLASQYASKDCGSVELKKYVGSFLDNSPFVKVSLFLPYIGFVNLGTDDLIGGSINVKYNVDVLSGDCVAFIKHSEKGVLYAYNGNCLTNVPVSGQNYANALRNYYESVAGVIPATTNGATGGPVGAVGGALAGTLSAASNIILNSKPTFQRSGNIGGSAGIMGVQKPFVIIERPNISVPNNIQHYVGQTSNITMSLSGCKGMTVVEHVHLNGINATSEELREIETILKGGVIL